MDMHDPAYPGELLQGWIDVLNMRVTTFAEHVGISRPMLSRILNGDSAVSAEMDIRLAEALGTSTGYWLKLQAQRDLWLARQRAVERKPVERLVA
jgi:antitoxin HigA-1